MFEQCCISLQFSVGWFYSSFSLRLENKDGTNQPLKQPVGTSLTSISHKRPLSDSSWKFSLWWLCSLMRQLARKKVMVMMIMHYIDLGIVSDWLLLMHKNPLLSKWQTTRHGHTTQIYKVLRQWTSDVFIVGVRDEHVTREWCLLILRQNYVHLRKQ